MRKILLFNQTKGKYALNIFSKLAREGRRVLFIDLRNTLGENKTNAFNFLNDPDKPDQYVQQLEPNLFYVEGHSNIYFQEFNLFYDLFKFDYFQKKLKTDDYDYVVLECGQNLSLINFNSLFYAEELITMIDLDNQGMDLLCKFARFNHQFNKLYGQRMFISKIIPVFNKHVNPDLLQFLHSEFTTDLVGEPIVMDKIKTEVFDKLALSVMSDEVRFDSSVEVLKKQKSINEYVDIMVENAGEEAPLRKFLN